MTTLLDESRPVARKPHGCNVCLGTIGTGDRYVRQRLVSDDGPYVFKVHALCDVAYWRAYRELELWDDEAPDFDDSIRPILESVFAVLTPTSSQMGGVTSGA